MSLAQYFRLLDIQARLALKADASRYFLGYIWWLLEPMLYVAVFYLVFNVILSSRHPDFLVFLMCGKLPFVWFSKTINQAANSIVGNAGLIGRIHIPKSLFPMAIVQESLYKQATVFALLAAILLLFGYSPSLTWAWIIPVILVNLLLIVAGSLLGAILVCFARDFSMIISLGMIFMLFISGIFWDVRLLDDPAMTDMVLTVNPLAFLLDAYRQVLMHGVRPDPGHLFLLGLLFAAAIVLLLWYMRRASQSLARRALTA
jgi:lipopolysaccharide transport system permease protein